MKRHDARKADQIRSVTISCNVLDHAAGSVIFEMGKTKVLCAVTMQNGVPPFLRGKNVGWLTAEYAMLPAATPTRTQRESSATKRAGRSVEISRFISRTLRTIVDLSSIGERTIMVDCDVLQADGGTRTASITAAYIALSLAQQKWLTSKEVATPIIKDALAAVSVGVIDDQALLDVNYVEDSMAHADFNFVMTQSEHIIEIQGGAEKQAISWDIFDQVRSLARSGIKDIFDAIEQKVPLIKDKSKVKAPLFSLQNRLSS